MSNAAAGHRRILLKISGEALMGGGDSGIDPEVIGRVAREIGDVVRAGLQVGLVIGGGNIFRGAGLAAAGMDRVTGDHMGMLATVINALAMRDSLRREGSRALVMSAFQIGQVCEPFQRDRAVQALENGTVVIFSAGTGNPFFTTDTAASLRAVEIGADLMLKATKVDGVYSDDPVVNPEAEFYSRLAYDDVIERKLNVMDATAIILCRDHGLPMRVFNMNKPGALMEVVTGGDVGTLVE